jgi:hypothetical protein
MAMRSSRPAVFWRKSGWRLVGACAATYLFVMSALDGGAVAAGLLLYAAIRLELEFQSRFLKPATISPSSPFVGSDPKSLTRLEQAVTASLKERNQELVQQLSVFIARHVANDRLESGRLQRELLQRLGGGEARGKAVEPHQPVVS